MKMSLKEKFESDWDSVENSLIYFFYQRMDDRDDIRDLVQETALKAWSKFSTLRGDFKNWVFAIARNVFIDYLRKNSQIIESYEDTYMVSGEAKPDEFILSKIQFQSLLDELDEIEKKCLLLHDFEGISLREISDQLGISISTVHHRLSKARDLIRQGFGKITDIKVRS